MVLCSMLIGFSVSQEIVDITLCELLRRQLFQKTKESPHKEWKPLIFMASLEFHALLRRFAILPLTLVAAVALTASSRPRTLSGNEAFRSKGLRSSRRDPESPDESPDLLERAPFQPEEEPYHKVLTWPELGAALLEGSP